MFHDLNNLINTLKSATSKLHNISVCLVPYAVRLVPYAIRHLSGIANLFEPLGPPVKTP
jgi:hypothetical protein